MGRTNMSLWPLIFMAIGAGILWWWVLPALNQIVPVTQ